MSASLTELRRLTEACAAPATELLGLAGACSASSIELHALTKVYRRGRRARHALRGITLSIPRGEIAILTGPNGSGKTTLLKIIATLVKPTGGRMSVLGHDVVSCPEGVRRIVSLSLATDRSFYWRLSAKQNLAFFARLRGLAGRDLAHELDAVSDQLGIRDLMAVPVRRLSTGALRKLSVARAAVGSPPVLLLDEPTASVDEAGRVLIWDLVARCADAGSAVLIATHDVNGSRTGLPGTARRRVVALREGRAEQYDRV